MNIMVQVAMFGWPIAVFGLFFVLPPRRAVLAAVILGWMFLPVAEIKLGAGLPTYNKLMAVSLSAFLGVLVFDGRRVLSFQPGWIDLPMLVWCLCPMAASFSNDLGAHDAFSALFYKVSFWGLPYLLGRLYCSTLLGLAELAKAIFLGGLLYVPFCLYEIRMSPQLHAKLYGYLQHEFGQTIRYGGYRPMVFMNHGIMVATWMAMSVLAGLALWRSGNLRRIGRVKVSWLLGGLLLTTVLCKSLGALVLLAIGAGMLWLCRVAPSRAVFIVLALVAPLYLAIRIPKVFSAKDLKEASSLVGEDRSGSLKFRLLNEDFLVDKAFRRPLFGWGLWGRARIHDAMGRDITVTDSLWIIELGNEGFLGLFGMLTVFLIPLYGLLRVLPNPDTWKHPFAAPAICCGVMVLLFLIDCLFNDMNNPAYVLAIGGLSRLRLGAIRKRTPKPVAVEGMTWAPRS
ncbi:MAG TPA: O-antigen ligase domain-containing protein [Planctomycetota bacterium]|nr:O-antigen ligase domain-containing protein [Planctomycetota bacterium]